MCETMGRMRLPALAGLLGVLAAIGWSLASAAAGEPPAIKPFGTPSTEREDAVPGYVELSDGSIHCGQLYLTRDKSLQVMDEKMQRQRDVPLRVVKQIDCQVKKEWLEKEWKFKELAKDEKMYTGRSYPAREYTHTITLNDGRTIEGELSGIIYAQPPTYKTTQRDTYRPQADPQRFLLHKRDKGEMGTELKSLIYVKLVKLGEEALKEGQQKASGKTAPDGKTSKKKPVTRGKVK